MYIKSASIKNIRSIKNCTLTFPDEQFAGWHVLIGDNGSGKSTVLKAISLALIGEQNALALRQNWNEWITRSHNSAQIDLEIIPTQKALWDTLPRQLIIQHDKYSGSITTPRKKIDESRIEEGFSAAFGPFRRFTGSDKEYERLMKFSPRFAAHLSIFGEDIALTEALEWLKDLHHKELEGRKESQLLKQIYEFINQDDFLPHQIRMADVSSEGVVFRDIQGFVIPVEQLSDGFRSILSMTFELIRQLSIAYPDEALFSKDGKKIVLSGVVLIDEIDAHLHPEWQRRIGFWLTEHFPKIQFIVTTHSPLVCQAAVKGSIWRLPKPATDEKTYQVQKNSEEWKRLVYGNILEAYSTDLFGEHIDRSEQAQAKYERLAELSTKELDGALTSSEKEEFAHLMKELPSTPYKRIYGVVHD